jgi:hypothetical protein
MAVDSSSERINGNQLNGTENLLVGSSAFHKHRDMVAMSSTNISGWWTIRSVVRHIPVGAAH